MHLDNDSWFIMESCLILLVISFIIHGLLLLVYELLIHDSYWMIQIHDQLWLSISTVDSDDLCFMSYVLCHMFCAMIWYNMIRYDMIWYDSNDNMISDFLIHRITHKSWHQSVKQNQGSQRFLGIHFPDKFRASNETILEPQTRQFWGLRRDNFGKLYWYNFSRK